jgi:hypothetical protein
VTLLQHLPHQTATSPTGCRPLLLLACPSAAATPPACGLLLLLLLLLLATGQQLLQGQDGRLLFHPDTAAAGVGTRCCCQPCCCWCLQGSVIGTCSCGCLLLRQRHKWLGLLLLLCCWVLLAVLLDPLPLLLEILTTDDVFSTHSVCSSSLPSCCWCGLCCCCCCCCWWWWWWLQASHRRPACCRRRRPRQVCEAHLLAHLGAAVAAGVSRLNSPALCISLLALQAAAASPGGAATPVPATASTRRPFWCTRCAAGCALGLAASTHTAGGGTSTGSARDVALGRHSRPAAAASTAWVLISRHLELLQLLQLCSTSPLLVMQCGWGCGGGRFRSSAAHQLLQC